MCHDDGFERDVFDDIIMDAKTPSIRVAWRFITFRTYYFQQGQAPDLGEQRHEHKNLLLRQTLSVRPPKPNRIPARVRKKVSLKVAGG